MLRQVIVTILGNVDSGKSRIIDCIKKTSIVESEPGKITQSIRAYSIYLDNIKDLCKELIDFKKIKVPGLLFIDTPGHAAFSNLRKRGGALEDIAILVIDINEGVKQQTIESLEILRANKTPFVIALNKIDLINGWRSDFNKILINNIKSQADSVRKALDDRLYNLVAKLHALGFNCERFDRVEDFTKIVAMIPTSAKTGEGLPELLVTMVGLAQRFLESSLSFNDNAPGEGTILEVYEEKGLGKCIDMILYSGKLKVNDTLVIGTIKDPFVTKVKAIFCDVNNQNKSTKQVSAALGVKIVLNDSENIIPGMPVRVANNNLEKIKSEIKSQVEETAFESDNEGIIVKSDYLGSLEAVISLLRERNIKIRKTSIGNINKKDIAEADSNKNHLYKVILGFNVGSLQTDKVKVFTNNVIYALIESFEKWFNSARKEEESEKLSSLVKPCKIKVLEGYIFRKSNPAVVGVDVLAGTLKAGSPLMKESFVDNAKSIQHEGKNIQEAAKGQSVALAMQKVTVGRQVREGDILYSDVPEEHFKAYKKLKNFLNSDEIQILKEVADIKRKSNPTWGV